MKNRGYLVALATTLLVSAVGRTMDKRVVDVRFTIEASDYRTKYGTEVSALETEVTQDLVRALRKQLRFFDFSPWSAGANHYRLTVSLSVLNPHRGVGTQEVWIYASLTDLRSQTLISRVRWLRYRDAGTDCVDDTRCRFPGRDELKLELRALFDSPDSYRDLIRKVLTEVPFSKGGHFVDEPAGWSLPFRQTDVCLDKFTQFRVFSDIQTPASTVTGKFIAQMQDQYIPDPTQVFGLLIGGDGKPEEVKVPLLHRYPTGIRVGDVYVVEYQRLTALQCGGAIAPATLPIPSMQEAHP
jgi:hypothetical protein